VRKGVLEVEHIGSCVSRQARQENIDVVYKVKIEVVYKAQEETQVAEERARGFFISLPFFLVRRAG
jgi:hypothetical protein